MQDFDWQQPASLARVNGREMLGDGRSRDLTVPIARGPVAALLDTYLEQRESDRGLCRLTIAGGFHLDGLEIEDLIEARP